MGMNQAGDGLVPLSEEMGELLTELQDRTDDEDLYGRLCNANRIGKPHIMFKIGEKVELKGHEWQIQAISAGEIILKPIRRL